MGILLPIFGTQSFSISPSTCGPLGGHWTKGIFGVEHPTGSNPTLAAETRVTGTSFLQFEDNCGASFVMMTLMRGGMESADAVPPIFFDEITIDETSQARLAYLPPPKRDWIAPTKCVVMDCDGPKHVLIHDLDGTLMGQGADASILARAEFMHQTRADSSKYTWNITPMTKVKAIYTDDGFKDSATVGEYEVPPEPTMFGERALVYSDIVLGKGPALTIRLAMLSDVRCDARAPFSMPSC